MVGISLQTMKGGIGGTNTVTNKNIKVGDLVMADEVTQLREKLGLGIILPASNTGDFLTIWWLSKSQGDDLLLVYDPIELEQATWLVKLT